jgi:hypothetical protein
MQDWTFFHRKVSEGELDLLLSGRKAGPHHEQTPGRWYCTQKRRQVSVYTMCIKPTLLLSNKSLNGDVSDCSKGKASQIV